MHKRKLIALVGESPNDTEPLCRLLEQIFPAPEFEFAPLLKRVNQEQLRGSLLDKDFQKKKRTEFGEFDGRRQPPRFQTILRIEFQQKRPAIVVFVRDLDALKTDKAALRLKKDWFSKSKSVVDGKALFLLNIFVLEALIWADIEVFKKIERWRGIEFENFADPTMIEKPKEELQKYFPYAESDCREIFPLLDAAQVSARCSYFQKFVRDLKKALA